MMKNLSGIIKKNNNEEKMSRHDYAVMQCSWENENEGELNLTDGIDCSLCRNKGIIYYIDENDNVVAKSCECSNQRKTFRRLEKCGITKSMLEKYTLSNFLENEGWQTDLKNNIKEYCQKLKEKPVWLLLTGVSGSGKTHLCTAVFQWLIRKNLNGEYLLWNEEVPKILALEKSSYEDNQIKYEKRLKFLQTVDVLYIDDFFKLTQSKWNDASISLAYKIINSRYNNNKITIISSEYSIGDINERDMAIAGRIVEKADNGNFVLNCGSQIERNWRLK